MRIPRIGPGAVVTAAFIGPGTVTACTRAGEQFGYALLWALVFSTLGAIALQEMSARLGVVGQVGLGEAVRRHFAERPALRWTAALLIASAIGVGNAAYQTGNLLGASLGAGLLLGGTPAQWVAALALFAGALLWVGSYRLLERVLVGMVIVMAVVFLATAAGVASDPGALLTGALVPTLPPGSALVALALVGTTIVPYNLFLHASAARQHWPDPSRLPDARADLVVAVGLGGLVSMAIVVTAAAAPAGDATVTTMAAQLEPLLGEWARAFFALGLFAAGLTSAITAPMAAAYALAGVFGWEANLASPRLRAVWIVVLLAGAGFAITRVNPIAAILFAQAANGLLLPLIAAFLLLVMNDRAVLGRAINGWVANVVGAGVVLLTLVLGLWKVITVG